MANEAALVELEERILAYFQRIGDMKAAASVALLIVEHVYYKHDSQATAVNQAHVFTKKWGFYGDLHPACKGKSKSVNEKEFNSKLLHPASFLGHPTVPPQPVDFCKKLEYLSTFIFEHGDEKSKTRALLCSVYYHASHYRNYKFHLH